MSATFLVTGFEPFGPHRSNSSWDALELLKPRWPADIVALRLPVHHVQAHEQLRRALVELQPHAVLCTGLAAGEVFRIEHRARRPAALAAERGELESRGRWPWEEMRGALQRAAVRVVDSEDAGQYVCESTYWSLLTYDAPPAPPCAAFLHVPPVSPQIPLEIIASAVGSVIETRHTALTREARETAAATPFRSPGPRAS